MVPKVYVPKVGGCVKFKGLDMYSPHFTNPNWQWMKVLEAGEQNCKVIHFNAGKEEGEPFVIETKNIWPPVYWSPRYEVYQYDEKAFNKIREWLKAGRGIAIWGCQALEVAGRMQFTPGDVLQKPHWSMELVEVVHDTDRLRFTLITKHPIPTGYPAQAMLPKEYAKEEKRQKAIRKKELADLKRHGIKVHNIKDGSYVAESWYETEKEVPVLE